MSTAEVFPPERNQAESLPSALELRLTALVEVVTRLETRVAALESSAPGRATSAAGSASDIPMVATATPPVALPAAAELPNSVRLTGLIGRTCLILGGATFIRALVDAGTIHRGWGVALGLAFAITWALLADRAKQPLDSAFHALASILIAYPLLVESTARFGILEPGLAAFLLLAVTCLHGAIAWRRNLQPIVWLATLTSLGSGFALMAGRRAIEPFLAVFLILGISTLWATYGRRWHGLRWPTALAANLGVLILTSLAAWPGGIPEIYRGISSERAMLFALALVVLYIGSFAIRMLQQQRVVNAFERVQTILVLLVGFGGAFRVALASGSGTGLLGTGASLAGLGCYATARRFAEEHDETRANFNFFTFLALIFLLLGGLILLPAPVFAALSGALGLGMMVVALRMQRTVLFLQSGIYLLTAGVTSGLVGWSFRAFLAPGGIGSPLLWSGFLSLTFLMSAVAWFQLHLPTDSIIRKVRPLILFLGATATAGAGALVVRICASLLASGTLEADLLAAVRTGVLSLLTIVMAWFGRRMPILQLRWLVYPMLIVTALKFLFEDLPVGRPLTLFLGFMCYGATLMLAPRLLKTPALPGGDNHPNASKPEVDS